MSQHEEHHHGIQVDEMKREACGYGVGVSDGEIDSPFGHRPPSRGERRMGSGALLTLIACGLALASAAKAATFLVSKTADTNDGTCDADCSLREAVIAANAAAGADTIVVPTGTFLLTIPDADEDFAANGDLDIRDELALNGLGTAATIVDGNNATRVFHLLTNTPVSIRDLAIRNASTSGFGAAIHHTGAGAVTLSNLVVTDNVAGGFGGAINNNSVGTISIQTSTISRNTTQGSSFGGGINNNWTGSISIADSVVSENTAGGWGGGVNNNWTGTIGITGSELSDNNATGWGGGINNNDDGAVTITLATINGNSAENGGGINNNDGGTVTVTSSSISANTATGTLGGGGILNNSLGTVTIAATTIGENDSLAGNGGGIHNNSGGTVAVANSTISGNTATANTGVGDGGGSGGEGGGIFNNASSGSVLLDFVTITGNESTAGGRSLHKAQSGGPGEFSLHNSIVANPESGSNCSGTFVSLGHNLASDASCALGAAGDLENTSPLLAPLAANGGPTETHGLLAGSPAIDSANATGAPATDQRGVARPVGPGFDIGAFEGTVGGGATPTLSIDSVTANEGDAGTTAFEFTVTLSAASAATVTIDFATADGTAIAGDDYTATSGTLTFAPGVVTQAVAVSVLGDTAIEAAETFFVDLSNPTNATLAGAQGIGTITNDDDAGGAAPIPTLSTWALLLLALLLAGFGSTRIRALHRR